MVFVTQRAAGQSCCPGRAPRSGCCSGAQSPAQTPEGWAHCRTSVSANVATSGKCEHQEDCGMAGRSRAVTFGWQEDVRGGHKQEQLGKTGEE